MGNQDPSDRILSLMSGKLQASYGYIRRRMAESGLEGLDVSHGDILWQLYAHGGRTMSELAHSIGRDKSTVTALVSKMEARGLVRRERGRADCRVAVVALTELGASYREAFLGISAEIRERLWAGFSESDRQTLARLLERLGESE